MEHSIFHFDEDLSHRGLSHATSSTNYSSESDHEVSSPDKVVSTSLDYKTPSEIIVPIHHIDFVTNNTFPNTQQNKTKVSKNDFELLKVIGQGAYGKVFLVKKTTGRDQGTFYAMKVLRKAELVLHPTSNASNSQIITERQILSKISSFPFLVKLFYAFQTNHKLYLLLEYCSGGELFMYLEKQKMLLEDQAIFYAGELILALSYLHQIGIIYRDLKPENVLLDAQGHVVLTDFGLSKVSLDQNKANTVCGTIEYMAPEVLANVQYDKTVDWWSLGALLFDMLTGNPPFSSNNRKKTMEMIMNKKLSIPYYLTADAKDLLTKLLKKTATVRLGFGPDGEEKIKNHRFFKKLDWVALENRKIKPPIQPHVTAPDYTGNFHSQFTSMPVVDSPVPESELLKQVQNEKEKDIFHGFSFVATSVLDHEHFHSNHLQSSSSKINDN